MLRPRALDIRRTNSASTEDVDSYFGELEKLLKNYLRYLIINVDQKGINQDRKPSPYTVQLADRNYHPLAVTSGRSKTNTDLWWGSAGGVALPPLLSF